MRPFARALVRAAARPAAMAAALTMSQMAAAAPIDGETARGMLYPEGTGARIALNGQAALSETDQKTLRILVETNGFGYFGAIAFSPDEGLMTEALQGAFDFHDVSAASAAAVAACNALRAPGTRPCIVAAQVFPDGYRAGRLEVSQSAGAAFAAQAGASGDTALAASRASGAFGLGTGAGAGAAALAACNAKAPKRDCRVVIEN